MKETETEAAREVADISNEVVRLIVRRAAEGASSPTIAAGFAYAFSRVATTSSEAVMLQKVLVTLLQEQINIQR